MLLPVAWSWVLLRSGISSDDILYSESVAWGITAVTAVQLGILKYAVRGWYNLLAAPLWFWLITDVVVLWLWNVGHW